MVYGDYKAEYTLLYCYADVHAPTVTLGTQLCRGSGRPFCIDAQFAVSMVPRRAGLYVPPSLFLFAKGNVWGIVFVPRFDLCYN